jgi:hypothetical protein
MVKSTFFPGQPVFSQLLNLIPPAIISQSVRRHRSNHYYKTFKAYDHLVTMLYACFHRCSSIREVVTGMQANYNKLAHLGLTTFPKRSTFAQANGARDPGFFEELYHSLYHHYYKRSPDSRNQKKLESRLFLMDSTTITLFSDIMKSAGSPAADGKRKGGAKAHVLLNAAQDVPSLIRLSHSARNDMIFMPDIKLPAGSILVFDKGYSHFARWQQWTEEKINWVTCLNDRHVFKVLEDNAVDEQQRQKGICTDQRILLGRGTRKTTLRIKVRLITYQDPVSGKSLRFLTNNYRFKASTVAELYRDRWQIELFFKRFKQHNQLRYFLGDTENAIKIQIWCAFITDLLIKIVKDQLKRKWSFANLASLIKHHLMNYLHLTRFLNAPDKISINKTTQSNIPDLFAT